MLNPLLDKAQMVLIGVYSSYVLCAIQLTEYIHKNSSLILKWYGEDPIVLPAPEMGLEFADGVCFSEGDEAVIDFVSKMDNGEDYYNTPNIGFKKGSTPN
ncbi:MAG: hypothetical protein R2861_05490 [Desulfobacterales bacterium]